MHTNLVNLLWDDECMELDNNDDDILNLDNFNSLFKSYKNIKLPIGWLSYGSKNAVRFYYVTFNIPTIIFKNL